MNVQKRLVKMPDSWIWDKCARPDWFSGFMKGNTELSVRSPKATSTPRATSFNKHNVNQLFDKLVTVIDRELFQEGDVWYLDETGVTTVQKLRSVVATKGVKQIGSITSAERVELVTLWVAVSASGNTASPMFISLRVKYNDHFIQDGSVSCVGTTHPSGWMAQDNFLKYLTQRHPKKNKALLLLDNHESHLYIDILNHARDNGVVMLLFSPHCSHNLQPQDRSVFVPFKRNLASGQDSWMPCNTGKTMTIYDSWYWKGKILKSATPVSIDHGFSDFSVFPFNRNVFCEDEFAPRSVTDWPDPNTNCEVFASNVSKDADREGEEIQIDNTSETNNGNNNDNTTCDWEMIDLYVHTFNRKDNTCPRWWRLDRAFHT